MPAGRRRRLSIALAGGLAVFAGAAASAARVPVPAPGCAPAALDASALLGGAVTVSPMPGAADASPQTEISFLGVPPAALGAVRVSGSRSGAHAGRLLAYSQGDGASFVPRTPFVPGERVTVTAGVTLQGRVAPLRFGFTVAQPDPLPTVPAPTHPTTRGAEQLFRSRPDLLPPIVTVHRRSAREASGDIFLAPYGAGPQAGPMILGRGGRLIWFHPLAPPLVAANLRVQVLDGTPVLTWWQGTITSHGFGVGVDEIASSGYRLLATVRAGDGLASDLHDFQITPAGAALVTAYYPVRCDLVSAGGARDSAVTDSLVQEIDIRTGLVRYEWTALDHVALAASYSVAANASPRWPLDFFHLNSVNLDSDGSLLISARNTWAVYDVDAASGMIRWTVGGKQSSFMEEPGASTAYQHDARPLGADEITLFDNGASPQQHLQSRGVILAVDSQTGTVSRREQFLHPGRPLLADSQGNLQALPDGHWFVGWGQEPDLSEFGPSGTLLFDASLPPGYESYRALRFRWSAAPATPPALAVSSTGAGPRHGLCELERRDGARALGALRGIRAAVARAGRDGAEPGLRDRDRASRRRRRAFRHGPRARRPRRGARRLPGRAVAARGSQSTSRGE